MSVNILIADDHDVIRSGLRPILEAHLNWHVVAEAANGKEAIARALETKPDVAIIDYALPLLNGVTVTKQIRSLLPKTEVLIFTMHDDESVIDDLLRAGARGYLLKSDAREHLLSAVEALSKHRPFFTPKVSETLLESHITRASPHKSPLTNRERVVAQLIAEGHSNREIAKILEISYKTVEIHRGSLMRKLNLNSTAALVRYAIRNGFVEA
jgi:DNA-binding NarL/FixJ family response regulator